MSIALYTDQAHNNLDFTGSKAGVDSVLTAFYHQTFNGDNRFGMQMLYGFEKFLLFRLYDELADSGVIPEVDKNQTAMITFAMNPTAEPDGPVFALCAKLSAIIRSEPVLKSLLTFCRSMHSCIPYVGNYDKNCLNRPIPPLQQKNLISAFFADL
jgi:hypothetical protein